MKFCALALDYDGTIARDDRLDPDVRRAIGELRAEGIAVVLATGRILEDLQRVAGDLHFADAVVAENGAIVFFPDSGYTAVNGQPPTDALLDALRHERIAFDAGRVVVEADAREAPRVLNVVRRLELPLALAFNRSRVMLLPQAISKATGLRQALTILRLSPHNAVAIGDAENDHELLQTCEVGVAVAWGSEALKTSADYVLPGDGPAAVADYIRTLANRRRVPTPLRTRRRLLLGHGDDGRPLSLAVRGRNVLVAGDTKSGKSWVTGLLCEQLILFGYSLCIFDPEGDYVSLEALPGVSVFGGPDPLPRPRDLLRAMRHADVSVVIDLSRVSHGDKAIYLKTALPALATLRRRIGTPHRIVVDEAHYFLHERDEAALLDLELNGYTLVSYHASRLPEAVLAASEAVIVTRESNPHEVETLFRLCRSCGEGSASEWQARLGRLAIGEAVVLPITDEAGGEIRHIRLTPRLTPHVRHLSKYVDMPVVPSRGFVFWQDGRPTGQRVTTLRDFVAVLEQAGGSGWSGHLRRGDFSRWLEEVFGDYPLAATVRAIEQEAQTAGTAGAARAVAQAIRSRYDFADLQWSAQDEATPGA